MNNCKQLDCQLHCKATSCLKDAVDADLEKEDRPLQDLLKETENVRNETTITEGISEQKTKNTN